ncbi:TIR domain-containing protein [Streptomyces sp. RG80]|uniref:TIR domain-containing protein n=1 Tax=Streptomyces sp. RG80 TaxID=3157340 RepID=UPI00338E1C12
MSDPDHWFFTSYSEVDEDVPYVARFHADVERGVRAQLGKQTPGGAFLDRETIEPGDRWRYRLLHGACTTRTMLALYSPSYYGSEWCAQEWTTFSARRNRYRRDSGAEDEHLLGVTWRNGPGSRPDSFDDQLLTGDFGPLYAESGLFHLVPEENEPKSPEYKKIVLAIATRLAAVLYKGTELPHLDLTEARTLTPLFGPERLRSVGVVVAYTDLPDDSEWGVWAIDKLSEQGYDVDAEVVSATHPGAVDRLRRALQRADRVLVLVSGSFFSHGDMSATDLDVALDGSTDWQRLIPVFIDPPEPEALPFSFRQFPGLTLRDLDEEGAGELLLESAKALAQTSGRPAGTGARFPGKRRPGTGFPGKAVARVPTAPAQLHIPLVNALLNADSISDEVIRPIWIRQTGIDVGSLDIARLPPRPLLFELIDLSVRQTGDCSVLATALDALEPGSQASRQVERIVRLLREAREDTARKELGSPTAESAQQPTADDVSPRPQPPKSALGTS